jgi:BirA family biotin operon repressor/biotin-[acetyl-CoA-carboxylase] ligase
VQPPEVQILRELLASDSGFVSGTALAGYLGVSRAAVWGHMEKMRSEGFEFEAVTRKGYRLTSAPRHIHPWLVEAHLRTRESVPILWLDTVDSTNSEAERQLASGKNGPFIVLARRQTAGRGRFGRKWHSDDTSNLYASFAFRPQLRPAQLQTFTLWMGVNVCACVANSCGIEPMVKWPNDILHNERKLGGMLTEARIDADQTRDLIFGLGLNVNADASAWPQEVRSRATTLRDAVGGEVDINHFAAAVIRRVLTAYDQFVSQSHRQTFQSLWMKHDALNGRDVTVNQAGRKLHGRALGIDAEGCLQLVAPDGTTVRLHAGEVTLRRQ